MKNTQDNSSATLEPETAAGGEGEIDIMQVAMEADAQPGSPLGTEAAKPKDDAQTKTEEGKPADGKDGKPAAKGTDGKPAANGSAKPEAKKDGEAKPGEKKESEFAKAKAESERRDRSWQALDKEKAEFRAKEGALTAELQGLRREIGEMRKRSQNTGPAKDANGATAADYDAMAKKYEEDGNTDMARAAKERAEALRKQSPGVDQSPAGDPWKAPEFQTDWQRHTQELIDQNKDLADPENPLVKATNALVNHPVYGRFFKSAPDGIKAAYDVACMMRDANAAQETKTQLTAAQAELTTAKTEIERLNGLLQPRGSHPAGATPGEKKVGDMSDADVRAIAAAADRGET